MDSHAQNTPQGGSATAGTACFTLFTPAHKCFSAHRCIFISAHAPENVDVPTARPTLPACCALVPESHGVPCPPNGGAPLARQPCPQRPLPAPHGRALPGRCRRCVAAGTRLRPTARRSAIAAALPLTACGARIACGARSAGGGGGAGTAGASHGLRGRRRWRTRSHVLLLGRAAVGGCRAAIRLALVRLGTLERTCGRAEVSVAVEGVPRGTPCEARREKYLYALVFIILCIARRASSLWQNDR